MLQIRNQKDRPRGACKEAKMNQLGSSCQVVIKAWFGEWKRRKSSGKIRVGESLGSKKSGSRNWI